jgi:hypothetical protein
MPKNVRDMLISQIENDLLDWEMVCRELINRVSCDEIKDMYHECGWQFYPGYDE